MTNQEIFDKIAGIIQELRDEKIEVTPTLSIQDDLGADSVELMEFIIAVEDAFEIEISDETADKLTDMNSLVELVQKSK
ncbi:Acyl carrier protein [Streptococcus sp. DD10]|uniref:acyl carrier protein n=1 Tax=Streptococcus sp. DD10 TaxID=1777878 RepID=UPI0007925E65|nr:acyl carrier protein [Streptococcus sp. DD10]KXT72629.1 Acyl carrier protein [Streptococcus sp. DD10]